MPCYFFWGEDEFALTQAVEKLKAQVLDPAWIQFNYEQFAGDRLESFDEALNQAMTPVFGMGGRLVWIKETKIGHQAADAFYQNLERTLAALPESSHLLFTSDKKPQKRLKAIKLLEKHHTQFSEFTLISPWQTEALIDRTGQWARQWGLRLSEEAVELLAIAVGNDTRRLTNELEKLQLFGSGEGAVIGRGEISRLVVSDTQNSLQLAKALGKGQRAIAIQLIYDLLNLNEPALKITATLVGQFRTWTKLKLLLEQGERDNQKIAKAIGIGNPKRIYFLSKEVHHLRGDRWLRCLPILLDLELQLKRGVPPDTALITAASKICTLCSGR